MAFGFMSTRVVERLLEEFQKAQAADNEDMFLSSLDTLTAGLSHRNRLVVLTCPCTYLAYVAPHQALLSNALSLLWEDTVIWLLRHGVPGGPPTILCSDGTANVCSALVCLLMSTAFDASSPKSIRCLKLILQNTPDVYDLHCLLGYDSFGTGSIMSMQLAHPVVHNLYTSWLSKWKRWIERSARKLWLCAAVPPMGPPTHVFPVVCV